MSTNNSAEVNAAQAAHTPTPWECVNIRGTWVIRQVNGWTIAETPGASAIEKHNAEFIVRAVNSHAELIAACKLAASLESEFIAVPEALDQFCQGNPDGAQYLRYLHGAMLSASRIAQAALAKAEVQS